MLDPSKQTSSDVFFSQADADRIYDELKILQMDLDDDPLSYGPKRLNSKVSEVRRNLSRCERLFLDVSQKLHFCKRQLKIDTLGLDLSKKYLLANDPETRSGRSVADRDAIAAGKLASEIHKVHELEMSEQDLGAVLMVIKAKRSDLKDTENRLRDQIHICQEEIGLGSRWGSKAPKGVDIDLTPGIATPADLSSMTDLLSGIEGEIHLAAANGEWTAPRTEEDETLDVIELAPKEEPTDPTLLDVPELGKDIEKLLPPTTNQTTTDSFLNFDITGMMGTNPAPMRKKEIKPLDDSVLDDLLVGFEES